MKKSHSCNRGPAKLPPRLFPVLATDRGRAQSTGSRHDISTGLVGDAAAAAELLERPRKEV